MERRELSRKDCLSRGAERAVAHSRVAVRYAVVCAAVQTSLRMCCRQIGHVSETCQRSFAGRTNAAGPPRLSGKAAHLWLISDPQTKL